MGWLINSKIISLNIATPIQLSYEELETRTSMHKIPVPELQVFENYIEGDVFGTPKLHGTPDSVLYIIGLSSILPYAKTLGHAEYKFGYVGENILADHFDETEISIGDIFEIGEVRVQATSPRIPCTKLNVSTRNREGRQLLVENRRTGVYFRILKEGTICPRDCIVRVQKAAVPFPLYELFDTVAFKKNWTEDQLARARANGAFSANLIRKFLT